ncbi:MAG: RNA polymerase sigma factor, partial [Gaiellaceae bacterium]
MRPTELTDAELLDAIKSDPSAFAAFYDRYETAIVGYLLRRTKDAELAADLTAEVFAAALTGAARYRPQNATAAPWLFTIAQHTLARSVRRGRVEARA